MTCALSQGNEGHSLRSAAPQFFFFSVFATLCYGPQVLSLDSRLRQFEMEREIEIETERDRQRCICEQSD
jgi:hypothetical protein